MSSLVSMGCISHGKDESEALSTLADMKTLWITDALAANEIIPAPRMDEQLPSGK
jgi:predicted RNase H-like HicB family nuclease